jgi:flagellar motor protein MotB
MSDGAHNRRRRRNDHGGEAHEEADERWLLTYADMITLLMALFIVMWAISTVNQSKFTELKQSLHSAFSGNVLNGGEGLLDGGQARVGRRPRQDLEPARRQQRPESRPRRGKHRQHPDLDVAVPLELGAFDGARDGRSPVPARSRRVRAASVRRRLRRPAPDCVEPHPGGPPAEPTCRARRPS